VQYLDAVQPQKSAPVIKSEISSGKAVISGNFSMSEAMEISNQINQALIK
jgi:preprotein translocase subunit SecD